MTTYVQVKNGFVSGSVIPADITAAKENIRAFLSTSVQDYQQKTNPLLYLEILKASRVLLGEDFRSFLIANHKNGLGPCSSVIMSILHYLNDKGSARNIISEVRRNEEIVRFNNSRTGAWETRFIVKQPTGLNGKASDMFDKIQNFDYYRLLRAIGVEALARFLLVLLGETSYE